MITVTTTDIKQFSFVRLYVSSIEPSDIKSFNNYTIAECEYAKEKPHLIPFFTYKFRWNIEVFFYQHKFFWSFGNYMVRNKKAIENYVNLLAIAYSFMGVLPFMHKSFAKYKFQSSQAIKNSIAYQISKELILSTFVQKIQKSKISEEVLETINSLICSDQAS